VAHRIISVPMWLAGWAETMRMFYLVVSKKKSAFFHFQYKEVILAKKNKEVMLSHLFKPYI
jgi:hypothetical protein